MDNIDKIFEVEWNEVPSLFSNTDVGTESLSLYGMFYGTESAYDRNGFLNSIWDRINRRKWFKDEWKRFKTLMKDFDKLSVDKLKEKDSKVRFNAKSIDIIIEASSIIKSNVDIEGKLLLHLKEAVNVIQRIDKKIFGAEDFAKSFKKYTSPGLALSAPLFLLQKTFTGMKFPNFIVNNMTEVVRDLADNPDFTYPSEINLLKGRNIGGVSTESIGQGILKFRRFLFITYIIGVVITVIAKLIMLKNLLNIDKAFTIKEAESVNEAFDNIVKDLLEVYNVPASKFNDFRSGYGLDKVLKSNFVIELDKATNGFKEKYVFNKEEKIDFIQRLKGVRDVDIKSITEGIEKIRSKEYENLIRGMKTISSVSTKVLTKHEDLYLMRTLEMLLNTNEFVTQRTMELLVVIAEDLNKF